jgi:uncharacterized protein (DUF302 family)
MDTMLGLTVRLKTDFEAAVRKTTEALQAEGFGVLTQIDVAQTLKQKLGLDFDPYRILGACNPSLAHRALTAAPEVGLLLPCNVVVRQIEPGVAEVSIVDPLAMMSIVNKPGVREVADEARARLDRVAEALGRS